LVVVLFGPDPDAPELNETILPDAQEPRVVIRDSKLCLSFVFFVVKDFGSPGVLGG
jgi:hypothetical protein